MQNFRRRLSAAILFRGNPARELRGELSRQQISRRNEGRFRPTSGEIFAGAPRLCPARSGNLQRPLLAMLFRVGLIGAPASANGDPDDGTVFFLSCFGFFFSRLLLCWPLAMGGSFNVYQDGTEAASWTAPGNICS